MGEEKHIRETIQDSDTVVQAYISNERKGGGVALGTKKWSLLLIFSHSHPEETSLVSSKSATPRK